MTARGKLAKVISGYEVAFNVGSEAGVKVDDVATAYEAIDIHDPDSSELLGTLERSIVKFKVTTVADRFSAGIVLDTIANPDYEPSAFLRGGRTGPQRLRKFVTADQERQSNRIVFVPVGCPVKFLTPEPPKQDEVVPF